MTNENPTVPARVGDLDPEVVTLEAELVDQDAKREIDKAVKGRRRIARKYVKWVRRRNPDATPAEIISMLEQHYVTAISVAGAAVTAGSIAGEVGIALIPVVGAASTRTKTAAKEAGKKATKEVTRAAAKESTKVAAKIAAFSVARRAAARIPVGGAQLQFEITALFALAVADIHGMNLDQAQAHALVYALSNGRVSQQQIAKMARDLAQSSNSETASAGQATVGGRRDFGHWANILADSLPGGAAQDLVRGVQTGVLEDIRSGLGGKQQAAVDYGVGALVGGITRFVFGREVVDAAQSAFPDAPNTFPVYLDVPAKPEKADSEPNKALEALEAAAKAAGGAITGAAGSVGGGTSRFLRSKRRRKRAADKAERELEAGSDQDVAPPA